MTLKSAVHQARQRFHPDFATNRRFWIYYTDVEHDALVVEYTMTTNGVPEVSSEKLIMEVDRLPNALRHNGGMMQFGPDGFLYIASGDNAQYEVNPQDPFTKMGAILRIDVYGVGGLADTIIASSEHSRIGTSQINDDHRAPFPRAGEGATVHVHDDLHQGVNAIHAHAIFPSSGAPVAVEVFFSPGERDAALAGLRQSFVFGTGAATVTTILTLAMPDRAKAVQQRHASQPYVGPVDPAQVCGHAFLPRPVARAHQDRAGPALLS